MYSAKEYAINVESHPNVILVITDDQRYGDLGCTENPWIQTPNIDGFYQESIRLTDFHVSPLCTPTRGAIMTGRRPVRNGAWATTWGRSILGRDERTIANVFQDAGYRTGMFGKWHLGDNYPFRPQDRGFETVVAHRGGGVGNTPDFWGNNYFDDTYFRNGAPESFEGCCTDVWFNEAKSFITAHRDEPLFAYIATNAPHFPYLVADRYAERYRGNDDIPEPEFYGMIANIDENFGQLRTHLDHLGIEHDTILIFMTDNGSSGGCELDTEGHVIRGYNAGMRGKKGSYYSGGHRVPFFIRWPTGGVVGPRHVDEMGLHVDILPTLAAMCGIVEDRHEELDGENLADIIRGNSDRLPGERSHFIQYRQHTDPPEKWTNAVITRKWRLIYGRELYDIKADPGERHDISEREPGVVDRLRSEFENWWNVIEPRIHAYQAVVLGSHKANPVRLDAFDVTGDVAWAQSQIAAAVRSSGTWRVSFERPGRYRFELRRWPLELEMSINEELPEEQFSALAQYGPETRSSFISPNKAGLKIFGDEIELEVGANAAVATFDIERTRECDLEAWFADDRGNIYGAYYVYVERVT